jgi:mannose-1-phosphate guanylyltransferase / phosphomannomutase
MGMHAAIVAGGFGTRAAALTGGRLPKALVPVAGVPIIIRQMRVLRREGINRVSVLAGHLGDQLRPVLEPEAATIGLNLEIVVEQAPLGTAGCLTVLDPATDDILIVYGDMLFDIALTPLYEFHRRQEALLTLVAHPNDHPRTSDLIVENGDVVKAIVPRRPRHTDDYRNLVPAGLYLASPSFFPQIQRGIRVDMISDLLPALIASGAKLAAYNTPEYLRDIGTPDRHNLAERDLVVGLVEQINKARTRPAIFFDCDGVLNEEPGLQGAITPNDVRIIPGAGAAVARAREAARLTIAVTNRPQVAKGFVTLEGLDHVLGRLEALLAADKGVLDRIYFCPHHPEIGFPGEVPALKIRCECRKPGTLLLRRAFADLPIDRTRSILIGDSLADIAAARGVGIWAYGVRTGHGCKDYQRYEREYGAAPIPDLMFDNVSDAVDFDVEYRELAAPITSAINKLLHGNCSPLVLGVCGRSRAGKTVTAHAIARALIEDGLTCLHVRLDDWIVPAQDRGPNCSAEARNRVSIMREVVHSLRAGKCVRAPGYNQATRGPNRTVTFDPAGQSFILLDGSFAGHQSIRDLIDFVVFAEVPVKLQRARFEAFYRWKGLDERAIDVLWQERSVDEWTAVDTQRNSASVVSNSGANHL